MVEISLAGAFLGGVLALLSPCSALLLPAFFAYAFKSRRELVLRTLVFLLGLCTLFIPLGMGAAWASSLVLDRRESMILVAGGVLVLLGVMELAGVGFSLLPQRWSAGGRGEGWVHVYLTGLVYGFAGFCSGPLLGAVLTLAAGSGSPLTGGALLFAYALGMAVPLLVLAGLWERYRLGERPWLRGRPLRLGRLSIHSHRLIAGLLFLLLGGMFVLTGGTVALEALYDRLGLLELSFRLQGAVTAATRGWLGWLWLGAMAGGAWWAWRRRRPTSGRFSARR